MQCEKFVNCTSGPTKRSMKLDEWKKKRGIIWSLPERQRIISYIYSVWSTPFVLKKRKCRKIKCRNIGLIDLKAIWPISPLMPNCYSVCIGQDWMKKNSRFEMSIYYSLLYILRIKEIIRGEVFWRRCLLSVSLFIYS